MEANGIRISILPVNSASFCAGNDDRAKLWVGRRCLDAPAQELAKQDATLKIALVHHPFDWLHPEESAKIRNKIEGAVDIVLRGHLHEPLAESVSTGTSDVLRCAAGAAYAGSKWPTSAFFADFDGQSVTLKPIRYENGHELWTTDPGVFPRDNGHQRSFPIPRLAPKAPVAPPRSKSAPSPTSAPVPVPAPAPPSGELTVGTKNLLLTRLAGSARSRPIRRPSFSSIANHLSQANEKYSTSP